MKQNQAEPSSQKNPEVWDCEVVFTKICLASTNPRKMKFLMMDLIWRQIGQTPTSLIMILLLGVTILRYSKAGAEEASCQARRILHQEKEGFHLIQRLRELDKDPMIDIDMKQRRGLVNWVIIIY
jgi:hypothetical protein